MSSPEGAPPRRDGVGGTDAAPPAAPAGPASPAPDAAAPGAARVIPSTPDIAPADAAPVLPGEHRGGFQRLPTGPVDVTEELAPADPDGEQPLVLWAMPEPAPPRGLAGWALGFSVVGLVASLFVGWGFPLGLVGVVAGILALRRPLESRSVAVWAIVLGAVSVVYSIGWLVFAAVASGLV